MHASHPRLCHKDLNAPAHDGITVQALNLQQTPETAKTLRAHDECSASNAARNGCPGKPYDIVSWLSDAGIDVQRWRFVSGGPRSYTSADIKGAVQITPGVMGM